MKTIDDITRLKIKAYLEVFIENLVEKYKDRVIQSFQSPSFYLKQHSSKGQLKPFHAAIFPPELLRINAFERGFSTSLGSTFEECAKLIALNHHKDAQRSFDLSGEISESAINEIEYQVNYFERKSEEGNDRPSLSDMIVKILETKDSTNLSERTIRADLYVLTKDNIEYFFEMKSPKPNKGQCLEVLQRILRIHCLKNKDRSKVRAYFTMAYNPFGNSKEDYHWSFAENYLPFDEATLIGHEFWDFVGGPSTFKELLEIYQEVGKEKSKYIFDSLIFGF